MVLLKFQIPLSWRQFLAEILGTFLLASLTHGAVAQSLGKNEILNPLAPGLALMIGILASGSTYMYSTFFHPKNTYCSVFQFKYISIPRRYFWRTFESSRYIGFMFGKKVCMETVSTLRSGAIFRSFYSCLCLVWKSLQNDCIGRVCIISILL